MAVRRPPEHCAYVPFTRAPVIALLGSVLSVPTARPYAAPKCTTYATQQGTARGRTAQGRGMDAGCAGSRAGVQGKSSVAPSLRSVRSLDCALCAAPYGLSVTLRYPDVLACHHECLLLPCVAAPA